MPLSNPPPEGSVHDNVIEKDGFFEDNLVWDVFGANSSQSAVVLSRFGEVSGYTIANNLRSNVALVTATAPATPCP